MAWKNTILWGKLSLAKQSIIWYKYLGPVSASVETEYCAFSFLEAALIHTAEASGDPEYMDLMERIIFNGALGARKKDEKAIAYMSSPNQLFATGDSSHYISDMQQYAPVYPTSCCPVVSVKPMPNPAKESPP